VIDADLTAFVEAPNHADGRERGRLGRELDDNGGRHAARR
jgi:hypothetical protein